MNTRERLGSHLRHLDLVAVPALAFAVSASLRYEYFPTGDNWPLLTEIRHFLDPAYLERDFYAREALLSFVRLPFVLLVALPIRLLGEAPVFHALFALNGIAYGFAVAWALLRAGLPRAAALTGAAGSVAFHQAFTIGFTDAVSGTILVPSQLAWTLAWLALALRLGRDETGWREIALCSASTLFAAQVGMLAFGAIAVADAARKRSLRLPRRTILGGLAVVAWPLVLYANAALNAAPGVVVTNSYYRNPEHYLPGLQPWFTLSESAAVVLVGAVLVIAAARGIGPRAGRVALIAVIAITAAAYVGLATTKIGLQVLPTPLTSLAEAIAFGTRGVIVLLAGIAITSVAYLRGLRPRAEVTLLAVFALVAAALSALAAGIGWPGALITFQGMRLTAGFEPIAFGILAWLALDLTREPEDDYDTRITHQRQRIPLGRIAATASGATAILAVVILATAIGNTRPFPSGGVFDMVEANTPVDALFIAPVDIQYFRGVTNRAQVVDWKHFPFRPDSVTEWRERIEAIAPGADAVGPRAAYDRRPPGALAAAAARYGAEYVVTRQQDLTCAGATILLEDRFGYRVFEVGPNGWLPEEC